MSNTDTRTQQQASDRRGGIIVTVVFAVAALYVVSSYVKFHQAEHGQIRYEAGQSDLCTKIKAKRPKIYETLVRDKIC